VVVFTQYDRLVRTKMFELEDDNDDMDPTVLDRQSKVEAGNVLDECAQCLERSLQGMETPMVPYANVSGTNSPSFVDQR